MRPLQCVDPRDAVAIGSLTDHPDRRFRQAPPLRRLWKSERVCNPQTSTAANSVADHEALIIRDCLTLIGDDPSAAHNATARLRRIGFYVSDWSVRGERLTPFVFDDLVAAGLISVQPTQH